jgi:hypothetical protein
MDTELVVTFLEKINRLRILSSKLQSAGFGRDTRSPLVAATGRAKSLLTGINET